MSDNRSCTAEYHMNVDLCICIWHIFWVHSYGMYLILDNDISTNGFFLTGNSLCLFSYFFPFRYSYPMRQRGSLCGRNIPFQLYQSLAVASRFDVIRTRATSSRCDCFQLSTAPESQRHGRKARRTTSRRP